MTRQEHIKNTVTKLNQLPDQKLQEVQDFVDFLLQKTDDKLLTKGITQLVNNSKLFEYIKDEEDLYTVNDLKEKYK